MAATQIGFLLYPNLTQLDLTGPAQVLARMPGAELHYVWKKLEPVPSDCGLALVPTDTFETCPDLDILCVPGGVACTEVMADEEALAWVRGQGEGTKWVTSVCTGSLILAAAGLLDGYRAACHWAWRDMLAPFGAEPTAQRVVVDRNRITGGGVTAGIDFAFRLVAEIHGPDMAEAIQLGLEYDPEPPSPGGVPERARPEIRAFVERMMEQRLAGRREAIEALVRPRPTPA
jgi:cyclohexyl-isocyanide hydratase